MNEVGREGTKRSRPPTEDLTRVVQGGPRHQDSQRVFLFFNGERRLAVERLSTIASSFPNYKREDEGWRLDLTL
jgi:hypothetical protein